MKEKKAVFQLTEEDAGRHVASVMGDEKGIYFTFTSDFGKIAEVLPEPLEPAFPMVSGSILYIDKPNFAQPYREAMIGVYAKYNGQVGMVPLSFMLSGPGAEMATHAGRESYGLPKKMCEREDCIRIERNGDVLRGIVERKGVRLLDVSLKLGEYNTPTAAAFYNGYEAGNQTTGYSYYCSLVPGGCDINPKYSGVNLFGNIIQYTHKTWNPGNVTVRLQSSQDDPWGHFPVFEGVGGAYGENDLDMQKLFVLGRLPAKNTVNRLLTTRYDHKVLGLED